MLWCGASVCKWHCLCLGVPLSVSQSSSVSWPICIGVCLHVGQCVCLLTWYLFVTVVCVGVCVCVIFLSEYQPGRPAGNHRGGPFLES